jgi:hypothetical protein
VHVGGNPKAHERGCERAHGQMATSQAFAGCERPREIVEPDHPGYAKTIVHKGGIAVIRDGGMERDLWAEVQSGICTAHYSVMRVSNGGDLRGFCC